ncbi:NADH-dependent flavin oxidoreductase [Streptococcus iniae]|uniref:NADH-dependent flavin oxidoreductase n=1 Tax=Streptococcus iniae TaxID=1346 RepID=UPI000EF66E51|nr:NADH-dependent flavin oxidoreductase [Streptococcus iniae]RLU53320.1 NADH-dependent oxidoreductase [Streptococcus iniae]RLU76576.1 NADH-dependent oxidoreductase [Streptococcus iniae]RLV04185.1 NADH-dependent oxidoreductase [Streptococcus iniae]RLV20929.1 NADH-dependent oxidoreductase [Streptococcus iniae]RLV26101.1 NADH-dependent oxidoreductase [Streptococcus iniae]
MKQLTDRLVSRHGAILDGRVVMPPMLTYSGQEGGFASSETLAYYGARSQAAAMVITEFHYVSETGGPCSRLGFPEQLGIQDDAHIPSIEAIARAIKKDGSKAILQLHHGGQQANGRAAKGLDVLAPSALDFDFLPYPVRELTNQEIDEIINDFGRATKRAIAAGFDGVEIHGANHYLLQQFFSKNSNRRQDSWGGSLEKRMAFPLAVVKEVASVIEAYAPKEFILGYRISPEEIHGEMVGYTYKESMTLIAEVATYGFDYISLSIWGGYDSKPQGSDQSYGQLFKEVVGKDTQILLVGSVFTEAAASEAVEKHTDLIGVGRGTLIDPKFGQKIKEGRGHDIVSEISPQQLENTYWTKGLRQAFSREDSLGLPPLPGQSSIQTS